MGRSKLFYIYHVSAKIKMGEALAEETVQRPVVVDVRALPEADAFAD